MNAFLIGDFILDRYELGKVERISPEAPVPVVKLIKRRSIPGNINHVGASLAGLGLAGYGCRNHEHRFITKLWRLQSRH